MNIMPVIPSPADRATPGRGERLDSPAEPFEQLLTSISRRDRKQPAARDAGSEAAEEKPSATDSEKAQSREAKVEADSSEAKSEGSAEASKEAQTPADSEDKPDTEDDTNAAEGADVAPVQPPQPAPATAEVGDGDAETPSAASSAAKEPHTGERLHPNAGKGQSSDSAATRSAAQPEPISAGNSEDTTAQGDGDSQPQQKPTTIAQPTQPGDDAASEPTEFHAGPKADARHDRASVAQPESPDDEVSREAGPVRQAATARPVGSGGTPIEAMQPVQPSAETVPSIDAAQPADRTSPNTTTTTVQQAPRELDEADQQRIATQTLRAVRSVVQQRGGTLTLHLSPPELGEMRIRLDMNHTVVRAQFETANEAVRTLLQQQMTQLHSALQSHGLTVEQIQVQMQPGANAGQDADGSDNGRSRGSFDQQRGEQGSDREQQRRRPRFQQKLLDLIA